VVYHTDQDPKGGAKPRLDREALDDISMAGLRHHHGHAAGVLTFHTANENGPTSLAGGFRGLPGRMTPANLVAAVFRPNAGLSGGAHEPMRSTCLSNFAPDRLGRLAWAATRTGTARDISRFRRFCGLPSTVTAATSISADAFARRSSGRPRPAQLERVLTRSLGPSSIPFLGDGVMLGTAWIDRPVDTRGCTPASTSLPCSMEVQPCPCHLRPVIRLRH
jgi:hypothetical protein